MKKVIIFIMCLALFTTGCESKSTAVVSDQEKKEVVKQVIPFGERKYIYTNGITTTTKEVNTKDENGIQLAEIYTIISGLKDKVVQDKINKELKEVGERQLEKLEKELRSEKDVWLLTRKSLHSYIAYNCNNAIFVNFNPSIEANLKDRNPYAKGSSFYYGYDLNTGERITFEDLFKPDSNYKTKINNYICQYIIQNNLDDYEYGAMTKPFQGIRENQSFTFSNEGLWIILDEKNDEFLKGDYFNQILIPLDYIGEDLYIFDKYFDEGKSIYTKEKLNKKLLPNKIQYKADKFIEEGGNNYFIRISNGEFINVPNKDIENKLNEMLTYDFDINDFKKKVSELQDKHKHSNLMNDVSLHLNAGGYLSVTITKSEAIGDKSIKSSFEVLNYDFNKNKIMNFEDIFVDQSEFEKVLKKQVKEMYNPPREELQDRLVSDALKKEKFFLEEYGINVYIPQENADIRYGELWVYIGFDQIGLDNIKFLN